MMAERNSYYVEAAIRRSASEAMRSLQHANARHGRMMLGIDLPWLAGHIAFQPSCIPDFYSFIIGAGDKKGMVRCHGYPINRSRMGVEMSKEGNFWSF